VSGKLVGGVSHADREDQTSVGSSIMAMPSEAPEQIRSAGFAEMSRAVVSAAADLVGTVERAVVGDANVRTARGNAWAAICADRARARARDEMDQLVRALLANGPRTRAAGAATAAVISRAEAAAERTAAEPSGERAPRAGSGSSRTRPTTPKRNTGQNQTTGHRAGQNQSGATRRTGQNQPATSRRTGRGQRAVGSSPRSSASQTALVSTGSSSR
jgi:hypothetical protein